jgi:hypothetical protein
MDGGGLPQFPQPHHSGISTLLWYVSGVALYVRFPLVSAVLTSLLARASLSPKRTPRR